MRLWGAVLVLAAGCGRIGFTATTDGEVSGDGVTSSDGVVPAEACPAFASFCDGFESGNLSAWSGTTLAAGGTVQAESSIVHTGHYALECVGPASTQFKAVVNHSFPNQTSGMIAVREWMYAPQPLVAFDQLISVDGAANNGDYVDVNGSANNTWMASEGDGPSATVLANDGSTTPIQQSAWICVELDVMLATTGPSLGLYVGDQEIVTASMVTPSPGYSAEYTGLAGVPSSGVTVYVDDVVMAAQHIGCQ
jgi:hypothetical protein